MERLTTDKRAPEKSVVKDVYNATIESARDGLEELVASFYHVLWEMAALREQLKRYEDLEQQKKLLKLPCAVGDTVWDIDFGRPIGYEVTGFSFGSMDYDDWEEGRVLDQVVVYYTNDCGSITGSFAVSEMGKTVFLTREAAEAALRGR